MTIQQSLFSLEETPTVVPRCNVTMYTDGSCIPNPGPGGWAVVYLYNGKYKELSGSSASETTNNRMELLAVINGLKELNIPCRVLIYTDSLYVARPFQTGSYRGWQRRWGLGDGVGMPNEDLWRQLVEEVERHVVQFEWVKGHNGNPHNERCDELANYQAINGPRKVG